MSLHMCHTLHVLIDRFVANSVHPPPPFLFDQENPLMLYMKKECKKVFEDYKMIAVVQNNGSNAEDMMILKHRLHKHGISVKSFPNQVIKICQHILGSACLKKNPACWCSGPENEPWCSAELISLVFRWRCRFWMKVCTVTWLLCSSAR